MDSVHHAIVALASPPTEMSALSAVFQTVPHAKLIIIAAFAKLDIV
jgi:hypothetical protein